MKAETLHIRMREATQTRIELTFCASLTEHLPKLLPPRVRAKLQQRAIDLNAIARQAEAADYPPSELFCFADGPQVLRAWLE